jgi:hypothetical protein
MKATAPTAAPSQQGGGIYSSAGTSDTYFSSTIAGNGLDPASSTVGSVVGMNFRSANAGTRSFSNTIIANPVGLGTNCSGNTPYTISGTPNVDFPQDGTQPCFTPGPTITNVDPQLGALGSNGGPTPTMLPALTSPVIDRGSSSDQTIDPTHDQRGLTRPVVFPGLAHPFDGSDIGAVEVQQACAGQSTPTSGCPAPIPTPTATAGPTGLRAAALAKCKKKHTKKARKKCRKRANALPI